MPAIGLVVLLFTASACGSDTNDAETAATTNAARSARALSAAEAQQVSAVIALMDDGYRLAGPVCEIEAPLDYLPDNGIFGGHLFLHAFRIKGKRAGSQPLVVTFASNHNAAAGPGMVIAVGKAANALHTGFPNGASVREPITAHTPGVAEVVRCAEAAH